MVDKFNKNYTLFPYGNSIIDSRIYLQRGSNKFLQENEEEVQKLKKEYHKKESEVLKYLRTILLEIQRMRETKTENLQEFLLKIENEINNTLKKYKIENEKLKKFLFEEKEKVKDLSRNLEECKYKNRKLINLLKEKEVKIRDIRESVVNYKIENEKLKKHLKNKEEEIGRLRENSDVLNRENTQKRNLMILEAKKMIGSLEIVYKFRDDITSKYSDIFDSDKVDRLYLVLSHFVSTLVTLYISAELTGDEELKQKVKAGLIKLESILPSLKNLGELLFLDQAIREEEKDEILEKMRSVFRAKATSLYIPIRDYSKSLYYLITQIIEDVFGSHRGPK